MSEQHERALRDGLKALAETTRQSGASRRVEEAVLSAMASPPASVIAGSPLSQTTRWFTLAAAAALVFASVSGAWLAGVVRHPGPTIIRPAGFVEIPGAWGLPPIESGSIIRVTLPIGALPQYGLAIPGDVSDGHVDADLLLAQDGMPRAIRLVQDETRSAP